MLLSDIRIYPVKSCAGVSRNMAEVQARGLLGDRRAMLIDASGRFISQRSHGRMARIGAHLDGEQITLGVDGEAVPVTLSERRADVTVWKDQVNARLADDFVNSKLSAFLEEDIRLVVMDDQSARAIETDWAEGQVSFADAYPVLIANTASLAALSETAGRTISMDQFRPNLVVETRAPWAEDGWKVLRIGDVIFDMIKPCTRCEVTKLDPATGEMKHPETMEALIKTRRSGDARVKGVLFGWNAVPRASGTLRAGDAVHVIETGTPWSIVTEVT